MYLHLDTLKFRWLVIDQSSNNVIAKVEENYAYLLSIFKGFKPLICAV